MTDQELYKLQVLKNILEVFKVNGVQCDVSLDQETLLFNVKENDVPYRNELVEAGATYSISHQCWTYWSNEE